MAQMSPKAMSILIIDDDASMCETLVDILREKGYAAERMVGGEGIMEALESKAYDIVLLDFKMPKKNGLEVFREIKNARPETVVIMMTAYSLEKMMEQCLAEGAFGILHKPLDINDVVKQIEAAKDGILVMVVNDEPRMRESLCDLLKEKGYYVTVASDGKDAIEKAKKMPQHVLIVDSKLPVLNGIETYMFMKKINPKVRAVLMTAYKEEASDLMNNAANRDIYTCLHKPVDPDKIIDLIERISKDIKRGV